MRTGLVTPVLKKPGLNVDDCKNYTPVTNLSTFSKILLERLALVRLKSHITTAHCSQPTVITALNGDCCRQNRRRHVSTAMDHGHVVTVVGFDVWPAFDAVCHRTLIDRLQSSE